MKDVCSQLAVLDSIMIYSMEVLQYCQISLSLFLNKSSYHCLPAVCEHAYSLAQNLDPNSEGRGVLQFKTGLMSVIKVYSRLWNLFPFLFLKKSYVHVKMI